MATICQMLRAFLTRINAAGEGQQATGRPATLAAKHLQLLLSCGF